MALFAATSRSLPGRGPAPGLRFTLYAILCVVLMYLDQRGNWLEYARFGLSAAAYPVQLAVNSPSAAWHWIQESFKTRATLTGDNEVLRERNRELEQLSLRFEALEKENAQLRGLRDNLPSLAERWLPAEAVSVDLSTLRQRMVLNKGASSGVFKGQTVLGNGGVVGQVLRAGPWSAEVILVTDPEHAVPVQVLRSGLRTIAVGLGNTDTLSLPYLPLNSDIRVDDVLVTSGLGGVFPQGYPVAMVTTVGRDPGQPLAQVRARPLAHIDGEREVSLVWFTPGHPAAPTPAEGIEPAPGLATTSQAAPPKPKPAPVVAPAVTPTAAPTNAPANTPADAPSAAPAAPAVEPATDEADVPEGPK